MFACIHGHGTPVLACAYAFSPLVEETAPDTAVIDIGALGRLFGPPEKIAEALRQRASESITARSRSRLGNGLETQEPASPFQSRDRKGADISANQGSGSGGSLNFSIGIASNPDAAIHAARGFAGTTLILSGEDLGPLPVDLLSPPPEILETLDQWGIRTFGDLAGLPEPGVAARLGPEGVRLWKLARGEGSRPLKPAYPEPVFEEAMELEYAVALLEPLAFILARLLNQLCRKLEERGLAAQELNVGLRLEDRKEHRSALRLPVPMRNPRAFLKLLQLDLERHPPPAPVTGVSITAQPARPRVHQEGLFTPLAPEPEKLELTLARIEALVGEGHAGWPELPDTHRPGTFLMTRNFLSPTRRNGPKETIQRLAFRAYRPARAAQVRIVGERPAQVSAKGIRGQVKTAAGPWRSSGDWWTVEGWARDEWDIELSDGALYRLYCEQGRWFVEGSYD